MSIEDTNLDDFGQWLLGEILDGNEAWDGRRTWTWDDLDLACEISAADLVHGVIDAHSDEEVVRIAREYEAKFMESSTKIIARIQDDVRADMEAQRLIEQAENEQMNRGAMR